MKNSRIDIPVQIQMRSSNTFSRLFYNVISILLFQSISFSQESEKEEEDEYDYIWLGDEIKDTIIQIREM